MGQYLSYDDLKEFENIGKNITLKDSVTILLFGILLFVVIKIEFSLV
jgi:hypothetical protein